MRPFKKNIYISWSVNDPGLYWWMYRNLDQLLVLKSLMWLPEPGVVTCVVLYLLTAAPFSRSHAKLSWFGLGLLFIPFDFSHHLLEAQDVCQCLLFICTCRWVGYTQLLFPSNALILFWQTYSETPLYLHTVRRSTL